MIDEKKLIEDIEKEIEFAVKCNMPDMVAGMRQIASIIENQPKIGEWIPVSERYPKNEEEVEITYTCKDHETGEISYFTARAIHEDGTMNTEDSGYLWDNTDNWEYEEEKDAYIIPEGWWESVRFSESEGDGIVDMPVIAWRPIPEPYRTEKENNPEWKDRMMQTFLGGRR